MNNYPEILKATKLARTLISDPKNWTQAAFARNESGFPVKFSNPSATCFCSLGAVRLTSSLIPSLAEDVEYELFLTSHQIRGKGVAMLNDTTDHETVLTMFDLTIKRLEEISLLSRKDAV